jgi:hypothetical protein
MGRVGEAAAVAKWCFRQEATACDKEDDSAVESSGRSGEGETGSGSCIGDKAPGKCETGGEEKMGS